MYYQVHTIAPDILGNNQENFHLVPRVDVLESSSEVIFIFEMPGVEENSVHVEVKDSMLFVGGNISEGVAGNEPLNILYRERENVKKYSRFLSVPPEADLDNAAASVRNGLLTIRFPRKQKGRRLPVNQYQQQSPVQTQFSQGQNLQHQGQDPQYVPNMQQTVNFQQESKQNYQQFPNTPQMQNPPQI